MRLLFTLLTACALKAALPPGASAGEWPQFRGPDGGGHSLETNLPVHWSDTENIAWKTDVDGEGWSSPVVLNGRLVVTAAAPKRFSKSIGLRVICLDAKTGGTLWDREAFAQDRHLNIHQKNTHASATPVVDEDGVYVLFGPHGAARLDWRGEVVWKNDDFDFPPVHGNGGSPILYRDKMIFNCDGGEDPFLLALNKETGAVEWKTFRFANAAKKFSFCTPLLIEDAGRAQLISPGGYLLGSYDPDTGKELWRIHYRGYSVVPRPVHAHGLIHFSTGFDWPVFMAVRPDGEGDVTETHVAWTQKRGAPTIPSPLAVGDYIYLLADNGVASCLDARTGEQQWMERALGQSSASPVYADGRIYLQDEWGKSVVLKPGKEYEVLARNDLKDEVLASYAVADRSIYIRGKNAIYCVRKE